MRLIRSVLGAAVLALCLPVPSFAGGLDALRAFARDTRAAEGRFEQEVLAQSGRKPQRSSGSFAFQRPGLFRWSYEKPYPQLLVADGQKLWSYDPDLKQATVKPIGDALGSTPAALLAGEGAFEEAFNLTEQPSSEGLDWVAAEPRRTDSGFVSVRLGFAGTELRVMELLDHFGQRTHLQFSNLSRNPTLDRGVFRFVPPEGVDVVGEAGAAR